MAYINKLIKSKFCAKCALVQRCTSNPSRHEDIARVSLARKWQKRSHHFVKMTKKISSFHCRFSKTTNINEFRLSNINFSSIDEEFSFNKAYLFTFIVSLLHEWKRFLAAIKVASREVFYNSYPL